MKVLWIFSVICNAAAVFAATIDAPLWDWQSNLNMAFAIGSAYAMGVCK